MLSFQQIGAIAEAVVGQEMKHSEVAARMNISEDEVTRAMMVYRGEILFQGNKVLGKPANTYSKPYHVWKNGIAYTYTSITHAANEMDVLPIKVAQFAKPTILSKLQKL